MDRVEQIRQRERLRIVVPHPRPAEALSAQCKVELGAETRGNGNAPVVHVGNGGREMELRFLASVAFAEERLEGTDFRIGLCPRTRIGATRLLPVQIVPERNRGRMQRERNPTIRHRIHRRRLVAKTEQSARHGRSAQLENRTQRRLAESIAPHLQMSRPIGQLLAENVLERHAR